MEPPIWAWIALIAAVPVLTAVDVLVFARGRHEVSAKAASLWTLAWVALGLGFTGIIGATQGGTAAGEYIAGYLVEWSLSIDNLFVFAVIFAYFAVPKDIQPRVLLFGVLGALVFRGIFIAIGAAALGAAHWVIYIFGAFLIFTAYRLARSSGEQVDPSKNRLLRLVNRFVPSTDGYRGQKVFVHERGRRLATPIFAVLLVVASTDVAFAVELDPGHLRHHRRGLHRPRGQHLRRPGPAGRLLPDRRRARPLRVPPLRPRGGPGRRRPEDADQRVLRPAGLDDARRRRGDPRHRRSWRRSGRRAHRERESEEAGAPPPARTPVP